MMDQDYFAGYRDGIEDYQKKAGYFWPARIGTLKAIKALAKGAKGRAFRHPGRFINTAESLRLSQISPSHRWTTEGFKAIRRSAHKDVFPGKTKSLKLIQQMGREL